MKPGDLPTLNFKKDGTFDVRALETAFRPWMLWSDRSKLLGGLDRSCGGVYLWAYSPDGLPPVVRLEVMPKEIIYIGDAKDLDKRPLRGGHHRLDRYEELSGDKHRNFLYVSVAPLFDTGCDDYEIWRVRSLYLEARLYLMYAEQHNEPPLFRFKKNRPEALLAEKRARRLRDAIARRRRI
jgi:hypothetical protein